MLLKTYSLSIASLPYNPKPRYQHLLPKPSEPFTPKAGATHTHEPTKTVCSNTLVARYSADL